MSIRVFKENEYSTDVETITPIMNIEEIEELLNSKDTLGVDSGSDWGDGAYSENYIPIVWGGNFESKIDKWCSITDLEKEGWFFAVDKKNEIVIATNPNEKEYELNLNNFGWFKELEIF